MEPITVDFTADGRHLIAGGGDRVSVYIDSTNGKVSRRMDRDAEPAGYLYVSEDGRRFGVQFFKADNMLEPASVTVWDVESGRKVVEWTPPSLVLSIAWSTTEAYSRRRQRKMPWTSGGFCRQSLHNRNRHYYRRTAGRN